MSAKRKAEQHALLWVLIVEDSEDDCLLMAEALRQGGYRLSFERVDTSSSLGEALRRRSWDVVVCDYSLPHLDMPRALNQVRESDADVPFIVVSGTIGEEVAVSTMKLGAHDYLMKNNLTRLAAAVTRELREAEARRGHRRSEEALRASEERYRRLVELSPDAILVTDQSGIVFANPAAIELFGAQSLDQLLGKSLYDLSPPEFHAAIRERMAAVIAGRPVPMMEKKILRSDGSLRDVEATACLYGDHGFPAFQMLLRDVTERKRTERALADELRRKDEFLAMLGHELRNPLSSMRNAVSLLQRPDRSESVDRHANEILDRQVTHLSRLVDDLLDVSRVTHGKIHLRRERLDIAAVVRATREEYQRAVAKSELRLEARFPEAPVWVDADPTRLAQIVGNLLHNAIKFTPRGGQVMLEVGKDDSGTTAVVTVRDNGLGMEPRMIESLFQPFAQADRSLERSMGGLGLGLALVKGLVGLHGGSIVATSGGKGQGSEFRVELPLAEAPTTAAQGLPESSPTVSRRILIVEDNVDAAESMRLLLELEGHTVEVAQDGATALEVARESHPEVIFCDIGLPHGMNGYQFAERFLHDPTMQPAELIAITGYGADEDKRRAARAGFDRYLTKPVAPAEMMRILEPGQQPGTPRFSH